MQMNKYIYELHTDILYGCVTYGIKAIEYSTNKVVEVAYNISPNLEMVQSCIELINKHALSPIHLHDIISDMFI